MEEKKVKLISNKKLLLSASILVSSIIIIGLSLTYAYFETTYTGSENVTGNKAATLNVTTNLDTANVINATEIPLINSGDVESKAQKFTFTVTNNNNSTVKAKYSVKLSNYSISKNLQSKYFKWKLVINPSGSTPKSTATGTFANGSEPTSSANDLVSNLNMNLISNVDLTIGATDTLNFYIWLENDATTNQLYLNSGTFNGKISVTAVPSK